MEKEDDRVQAEDGAKAGQGGGPLGAFWNQWVNTAAGGTYITVPQEGTLWVGYAFSDTPPLAIGVRHADSTITPISVGENLILVGAGDMLFYQLANPASDSIQLAYQLRIPPAD